MSHVEAKDMGIKPIQFSPGRSHSEHRGVVEALGGEVKAWVVGRWGLEVGTLGGVGGKETVALSIKWRKNCFEKLEIGNWNWKMTTMTLRRVGVNSKISGPSVCQTKKFHELSSRTSKPLSSYPPPFSLPARPFEFSLWVLPWHSKWKFNNWKTCKIYIKIRITLTWNHLAHLKTLKIIEKPQKPTWKGIKRVIIYAQA